LNPEEFDAMVDELSMDRASTETTVTMATPFEEFIIPDFTDILLVINDLVLLG
jgi:hypothetical protein